MINVVLVDDEKWSLYGLMHLINWEEYGCRIAATAMDGNSALEICRKLHPDLLITDICMPDMDGLELARKLQNEQEGIGIVFITGHEEIKYAQSAVRLGVFDYLLKPISAGDLEELIGKFSAHLSAKKHLPPEALFFSLFYEGNTQSIAESLRPLGLAADENTRVRALTLEYAREPVTGGGNVFDYADGKAIAFRTGRTQLTCYCLYSDRMTNELLEDLYRRLDSERPDHIGISLAMTPGDKFWEAFRQSSVALRTAVFWKLNEHVVYTEEADLAYVASALRKMTAMLKSGEQADICVREWLSALRNIQIDEFEKQLNEGLWVYRRYREGISDPDTGFKLTLDEFEDFGQIEAYFLDMDKKEKEEESNAEQLVQKVLLYMDEYYTEKISLTMIAKRFFINPCYLSTLIHDYTGRTYSDILTEKRMNLVKSLLRDTQLPVVEISEKAGYNVYSHFLNLFKRQTGLPPSAWRVQHIADKKK